MGTSGLGPLSVMGSHMGILLILNVEILDLAWPKQLEQGGAACVLSTTTSF